jgi:hypothetical protein
MYPLPLAHVTPADSEAARKTGKAAAGAVPESAGCTEYRGRADDSDPAQLVALCWNCDRNRARGFSQRLRRGADAAW